MFWHLILQLYSLVLTLLKVSRLSTDDKDIEIIILRKQLDIMKRKQQKPLKLDRSEKLALAVLAANLKESTGRPIKQFKDIIRIFTPETIFGWHRQLARRKWTYKQKNKVGRPPITEQIKELVVQLAHENNW